jgi:RNAse (barnase) inhibitor barstar
MNKKVYEIDGSNSSNLDEFAANFTDKLNLEIDWRGNLDAFNDILHGGFGTPDEGFILVWKNSELSRHSLGYPETIKWLEERIQNCHPSNVEHFKQRLELAQQNKGKTIFDTLIEIISSDDHKDIELRLE